MNTPSSPPTANTADREIFISRVFDAPRELVFAAWTDPDHIGEWWGPTGFTTTTDTMDIRPGGVWRFVMHGPDGIDYPNKIVYIDVQSPERLVYHHDDDGAETDISFHVTVTFEDLGGKTKLSMRSVFPTAAGKDRVIQEFGAIEGGWQMMDRFGRELAGGKQPTDKLTLTLASDREIVLTRAFNAPAALVFDAMTRPEHVKRWWGCGAMTLPVCEIDLCVGGAWRYVLQTPDGQQFPFKGEYREIDPPGRWAHTQIYDVEPFSAFEALVTVELEEKDGKTLMKETILHQSVEGRDGHLQSGMEDGAASTLDRLAQILDEQLEQGAAR